MKPPFYTRYIIVAAVCLILGAAIVIQMVRINYNTYAQELIVKAQDYQGVTKTIYPERGTIYDRSGHVLATNQIGRECLKVAIESLSDIHRTIQHLSELRGDGDSSFFIDGVFVASKEHLFYCS